jgi:hypothetical protein
MGSKSDTNQSTPSNASAGDGSEHSLNSKRLLLPAAEVRFLLGGISSRTLLRWEKDGKLKPLRLLRHKLYVTEDVQQFVAEVRSWKA